MFRGLGPFDNKCLVSGGGGGLSIVGEWLVISLVFIFIYLLSSNKCVSDSLVMIFLRSRSVGGPTSSLFLSIVSSITVAQ